MMNQELVTALTLSIKVAAVATLGTLAVGTMLGYVLARFGFPGKELLDMLLTMPLVVPPVVTGYYLMLLFGTRGPVGRFLEQQLGVTVMFTWVGAAVAAFAVSLPLVVKTVRASVESVSPELVEASYTLGRGELETAWHVVLPLARRGIAAGTILAFARALGEFGATLMLAGNMPGKTATMPLAIYSAVAAGDWGGADRMVLLFTVVCGVALLAANRCAARSVGETRL